MLHDLRSNASLEVGPRACAALLAIAASIAVAVLLGSALQSDASFAGKNGRIAFSQLGVPGPGSEQIFTITGAGKGKTQLTEGRGAAAEPSYSADGRRIVYSRHGEIFVMNADGSDQTQVTDTGRNEQFPSFAPNGNSIVFETNTGIHTMRLNGSGEKELAGGTASCCGFHPEYSPDGRHIVFSRQAKHGQDLFLIDRDGRGARNLTKRFRDEFEAMVPISFWDPDFSPDGKKIVLSCNCEQRDFPQEYQDDLFVLKLQSMNLKRLTRTNWDELNGVFSPDGRKIAFAGSQNRGCHRCGIYVMGADGSNSRRIYKAPGSEPVYDPTWQPR